MKIIISGGGSGGHVYPAIAIAQALKSKGIENVLFVGAEGKIEMEKVPAAGFPIESLWISGLHRGELLRNILFPIKLVSSLWKAKKIIEKFKPDVVVGVGGFASGPVLKMAQMKSIPTLIQEQNSYPGITNKLLAGNAETICVAYPQMERFFDSDKIKFTGNPVRKDLLSVELLTSEAMSYFDLDQNKKTIFIFGGSLGARAINNAIYNKWSRIEALSDVQFLWQVGKAYYEEFSKSPLAACEHVKILPFIDRMDYAYSISDCIICRAGALTISEISLVGKPAIFVPSPNVAEDHQRKNAQALVDNKAAIMIEDKEANDILLDRALELLEDKDTQKRLSENIRRMAAPGADDIIADEIISLAQ
jgi:UDP-N-acetylglucosamine--N-acetylmuramyl-(pentapeptide) pyrophosphoryl-undecaprenol N-acetylglucosamine transferase